jgi:hypothetical protein
VSDLTWKTKTAYVSVKTDERYAEVKVDDQHWTYTIAPLNSLLEDDSEGFVVKVKVTGIKTEREGIRLCELIAAAVGE